MRLKKYTIILLVLFLSLTIFPSIVNADVGPKPSVDIIVKGMDTDNYWLDLLVTDKGEFSWLEITEEEKKQVEKLFNYKEEEFHPALLGGTNVPLSGKLKGEKVSDNTYLHEFSYIGTPEIFKIAILKDDNTLIISDVVHRKDYNSVVELDLRGVSLQGDIISPAGNVREITPWTRLTLEFIIRLILTIVIEMIIALLFKFTLKKSGKILLITNTITQIFLNIFILNVNAHYGSLAAIGAFITGEFLIVILESSVYAKYLTEKPMSRRITYGVVANIVSLAAGFGLYFIFLV